MTRPPWANAPAQRNPGAGAAQALAANANNLTPVGTGKTGGFAWRAGVYKETLTMIVTPKLEFAAYYTGAAKQGA